MTETPLRKYDVIVCGGGPAGLGAAIAAARSGARTLIIERLGYFGGMHTGAGVINWCDSQGGPIFDEMIQRLAALGVVRFNYEERYHVEPGRPNIDTEFSKMMAMQMLAEARVEVLLLTICHRAIVKDNSVTGVEVVNKAGRTVIEAQVVIDATADADIAATAGCEFVIGDPDDGRIQHCNFRAWFEGIDHERARQERPSDEQLLKWIRQAHEDGRITPPENLFQPQAETFPYNTRTNNLDVTSWEFERVNPLDPWQVSRTLAQCNIAVLQLVSFFREYLPGYEACRIRKMADVLGVRESRRIVGYYTLTEGDVRSGSKFEDGIAEACFFMDLHDSPPGRTIPYTAEEIWEGRPRRGDWYDIPYGCLLPLHIDQILVAGRCISAERIAHGSARVMTTCMYLGTAAGVAAAMSAHSGITVAALEGAFIREGIRAI